jgi:hypothetical protein
MLASCAGGKKEEQSNLSADSSVATITVPIAPSHATFSVWMEGRLNEKFLVWMYLDAKDGKVTGKYRYLPKKSFLKLEGTITTDRQISLQELDEKGQVSGTIKGKIILGKESWIFLQGKWEDPTQTKSLSVNLSPLFLSFSQDTVINTGQYQFVVSKISKVESGLGFPDPAEDEEGDEDNNQTVSRTYDFPAILADIEKKGALGNQNLILSSKYYEKITYFPDKSLIKALNKAITEDMKESELQSSIPETLAVKEDTFPETSESTYYISYAENNIMTVSTMNMSYSYGAAHPSGNYDLISYNLTNGKQLLASDLFDMKKLSGLNNIILNSMEDQCKDAMIEMNESGECYKLPADAKSEYAFGINDKNISVKLAGCSFPEVARYCNYVEIPRDKFQPIIRPDGPLGNL